MSIQARLSRNYISLAFARFAAKVISFAAAVLIARHLGAADFGVFVFSFAVTTLAVVLLQAGLTPLVVREIARDRGLAPRYLTISLLVRGAGGAIIIAAAAAAYAVLGGPGASAATAAAVALTFACLLASFTDVFQAFERMEFIAVVLVFNNVIVLALVGGAIHFHADLLAIISLYVGANALSLAFAAGICFAKFARPARRVGWRELGAFVRQAVPFSLSALVATLYWRSDAVLLKLLAGDRALGLYGAASRIVEGLVMVAGSFREAIYPILSRFWPASPDPFRDASRTAFKFLIALAIPIGVGTSLVAFQLFPLIYGAEYAAAWPVLAILIWALAAIFIRELSAATLFALDLEKLVLASNGLGAVTAIALNLLLIPRFSYLGPAFAGVAAAFATTAFNLIIIATKVRRLYPWRLALRPVAAAAVMAGALVLGWRLPVWLNICSGAAVYGAALLASRYYRLSQLAALFRAR